MYNDQEYAHVMEMIYREIDDDLREEGRIKGLEEGYMMGHEAATALQKNVDPIQYIFLGTVYGIAIALISLAIYNTYM